MAEFNIPEPVDGFDVPGCVGDGVFIVPEEDVFYRPAADNDMERLRTEP